MASDEENIENLSKMFQDGLDMYNNIDKTIKPTNSSEVQVEVKRSMSIFEKCTRLVSMAGMFSPNESIDEIATRDLQYLVLPAMLGTLSLKITSGDRKEIVECAEIYFKDFLQRCNDYGMSDYVFKETEDEETSKVKNENKTDFQLLKEMVHTRQSKIQRYQEQKDLQEKLEEYKTNMSNLNVDDDFKRKYTLTMIKIFIYKSIDEIRSIEMEKPMLEILEKMKSSEGESSKPCRTPPKSKPLRPVIITKDDVQKAVFGLGYPSLPIMTVQEFYDKRVQDGIFPDPSKGKQAPASLQERALAGVEVDGEELENIENEGKIEEEDPEHLQRLRDKDEFKDDHRRGWGNRMNRS